MKKRILFLIVLLGFMTGYVVGKHHRPRVFLAEEVTDAFLDEHVNPDPSPSTGSAWQHLKAKYEEIENKAVENKLSPYGQEKWTTNIKKGETQYQVFVFYNTLDENILITEKNILGTPVAPSN